MSKYKPTSPDEIQLARQLFYSVVCTYYEKYFTSDMREFLASINQDSVWLNVNIPDFIKFLQKREKI